MQVPQHKNRSTLENGGVDAIPGHIAAMVEVGQHTNKTRNRKTRLRFLTDFRAL